MLSDHSEEESKDEDLDHDDHEDEIPDIKLIVLQNETSFQLIMSEKMIFTHVNSIKMFQSTDQDYESLKNIHNLNIGEIKNYLKKSQHNLIMEGLKYDIGVSEFGEIRMGVKVDERIHKNKIPDEDKQFMGFPLAYHDFKEHQIKIQK